MRPARIMLVEDERIVALHLQQQLTKLGYKVSATAASGVQALRKLDEFRPDIVLMDIHIEGDMDGIETAAHIPAEYQIPVVYLTAYSEEATLERARATKPYGYLLKPFAERELHATIQMVLERRHAEMALKESEEALRSAHETLEKRVAERTADLAEANESLRLAYEQVERQSLELSTKAEQLAVARSVAEAANAAKSRFLATMSHELRTPLTGLIGFAELLLRKDFPPADRQRFLELLRDSARTLLALVNDILDLSKIEAGKLELEQIPFELRPLISGCSVLASLQAEARGLTLAATVADDVPVWLSGDPMRLRQVVLNLLANAVKFTEYGRVELDVRMRDGLMLVTISDTGMGIPAGQFDRLFRPFSQLEDSTSRRFGGTGLGLSICREIVEAMGGTIGAESVAGQGSKFWFSLPVTAAEEPLRPDAGADAPGQSLPARFVLLAEDDPVIQILIVTALEMTGHRVVQVDDGQAAVEAARAQRFDVILMDLQMPVMDGLAATQAIRAAETDRHVPIIALTANARSEDAERCRAAGMDEFLSKPVDLDQLLATVARLGGEGA
ncbi:MAG TPA: response regulator [Aliidongia sp.]|nr:response regulator [Aliidongia sp.]